MPDAIFDDPRLAAVYDTFEGPRPDLPVYLDIADELGARSLVDVGCGTGTFAVMASAVGLSVTAVDPARASIDVARAKVGADRIRWYVGEAAAAAGRTADLVVMTGNVAQIFLTDDHWLETLAAIRECLTGTGNVVFETRRPEARAWEQWAAPFATSSTVDGVGLVRQSRQLLSVELPLVSFRWTYDFPDGSTIASDSTLRFRGDEENRALLTRAGFEVREVRDAPDRPGLERVYFATP